MTKDQRVPINSTYPIENIYDKKNYVFSFLWYPAGVTWKKEKIKW
jgi:hypothetical protein